jgi:hypothetical protein
MCDRLGFPLQGCGTRTQTAGAREQNVSAMGPVCAIRVGKLDDCLKHLFDKEDITIDTGDTLISILQFP